MKVLHLCPLWFSISDSAPGGIETFLARLVAALDRLGCHSTLIAAGDSATAGKLLPVFPTTLCQEMAAGTVAEQIYYEQHQLRMALEHAPDFDVLHSHIGPGAYVLSGVPGIGGRVLHTQHTPVYPDLIWFRGKYSDMWVSTVSEFQARKMGASERCEVIHNGIDITAYDFSAPRGEGLFFIGRIEHGKGPDLAVQTARSLGMPLTLAGPIVDGHFFDTEIKPFLDDQIRYAGVLGHQEKCDLYRRSACALLPFRGEEPFGLVTVEAMACGTPVVALANGALPEIVEPGISGYLATEASELPALVEKAITLHRAAVREHVEKRFDIRLVASRYAALYERIAAGGN